MKTRIVFGVSAVMVYLLSVFGFAGASTVGIELRPLNQSIKVGETFDVDVFFVDYDPMVDTDYYAGSSIGLTFESTVIQFNSWTPQSGAVAFSSLTALPMQELAPFSGNLKPTSSGLLIAKVSFTAIDIGMSAVSVDDLHLSTADGATLPGVILPKDRATLTGATVNVVPLPGAIWMLGIGLIALASLGRKIQRLF